MTGWKSVAVLSRELLIAGVASAGILAHLWLRWGTDASVFVQNLPLYVALAAGGVPLVLDLALKTLRRRFGSDLLAGSLLSPPCCLASTSQARWLC